jgi:hypothetical protein
MQKKSELIQNCKDLMSTIQESERDIQAELRGVYREGDEMIDNERKKYKNSSEERLQKVIKIIIIIIMMMIFHFIDYDLSSFLLKKLKN